MTLTWYIRNKDSIISEFFSTIFPGSTAFCTKTNKLMKDVETIRPAQRVPYDLVGIAIDYRIRYYFDVTEKEDLAAWEGSGSLCNRPKEIEWEGGRATSWPSSFVNTSPSEIPVLGPDAIPVLSEERVDEFFDSLSSTLERINPVGRKLESADEALLNQYCFLLAHFEKVYRSKILDPIFQEQPYTSVDELLAIAQPHVIDDLSELSWHFYENTPDLTSTKAILNPDFEGSKDLPADADLILDGYLFDIKATINPKVTSELLYQLLGYILLDYSDSYSISGAGFYFARQGLWLHWPLDQFLKELTKQDDVSLDELRIRFEQVIAKL